MRIFKKIIVTFRLVTDKNILMVLRNSESNGLRSFMIEKLVFTTFLSNLLFEYISMIGKKHKRKSMTFVCRWIGQYRIADYKNKRNNRIVQSGIANAASFHCDIHVGRIQMRSSNNACHEMCRIIHNQSRKNNKRYNYNNIFAFL